MSLVRAGWTVVSIDYRVAPKVSLTEILMDCKQALAWVRPNLTRVLKKDMEMLHKASTGASAGAGASTADLSHDNVSVAWTGQVPATVLAASRQGKACPMVVTVGGESAGGHLSAVLGLTGNDPKWQPDAQNDATGDVDTSVEAVVDLFGVHDVLDESSHHYSVGGKGFRLYMRDVVVQRSFAHERHVFESLSPLCLVKSVFAADDGIKGTQPPPPPPPPPFFGIHGTHDTLVPVEEAATFYRELKKVRTKLNKQHGLDTADALVQVPFAPHAFNLTLNPWCYACNDAVVAFLHHQYDRCVARRARLTSSPPHSFAGGGASTELLVASSDASRPGESLVLDEIAVEDEAVDSHKQEQQHDSVVAEVEGQSAKL
jgi:acetyl esterase/lipase